MGVLHPLPHHALRMAALAALITIAIVVAVLAIPFGSLSSHDTSARQSLGAVANVPQTAGARPAASPDWVTNPLAPVTLSPIPRGEHQHR